MCSSETFDNANWASIQSGQTATGTCNANYVGSPTRLCNQNGSNGVWGSIINNPCVGNFYCYFVFSFFEV